MSTKRLLVRNAFIAAAQTATGLVPFRNLDFALAENRLPALAVLSAHDAVDDDTGDFAEPGYVVRFEAHVLVAGASDPEAAADVIEKALRDALTANPTLTGLAIDVAYRGGDWNFDLGDCAARRLAFDVRFLP